MLEVIIVQTPEVRWCATDPTKSLENYELREPTSSSYAFPKATRESFHSCVLGTMKFACSTPRKPVPAIHRYFVWNCSITTHKHRSTVASATTSKEEWPRLRSSLRAEDVRMNWRRREGEGAKGGTNCRTFEDVSIGRDRCRLSGDRLSVTTRI